MATRLIRSGAGIFGGTVIAFVLFLLIQALNQLVYPAPADLDRTDQEAVAAFIAGAPVSAMLIVLVSYAVGTLVGTFSAAKIAGRQPFAHAAAVGVVILAAGVANLMAIPHPTWFAVANLAIFVVAPFAGARLAGGVPAHESAAPADAEPAEPAAD